MKHQTARPFSRVLWLSVALASCMLLAPATGQAQGPSRGYTCEFHTQWGGGRDGTRTPDMMTSSTYSYWTEGLCAELEPDSSTPVNVLTTGTLHGSGTSSTQLGFCNDGRWVGEATLTVFGGPVIPLRQEVVFTRSTRVDAGGLAGAMTFSKDGSAVGGGEALIWSQWSGCQVNFNLEGTLEVTL